MSNTILPFSPTPRATETAAGASPQDRPATSAAAETPAAQSDSVTISAAALATTQLLNAARDADGVNQPAVEQIRSALQAGIYNVAPDDLAQAIATVLKETN